MELAGSPALPPSTGSSKSLHTSAQPAKPTARRSTLLVPQPARSAPSAPGPHDSSSDDDDDDDDSSSPAEDLTGSEDSNSEESTASDPSFGPTGLPKTPAPGKKRRHSKQRKKDRRDTLHLRNLETSRSTALVPVMHGNIKPYDNIKYLGENIGQLIEFWVQFYTYVDQERYEPPVWTMMPAHVRRRLIASDHENLGNGKFRNLTLKEIYAVMQKEFRPTDRLDFIRKLEANVEFAFNSHYRPTAQYFTPFYDAVLLYISRFSDVYDILAFGILDRKDIIPRCDTKNGGLVKSFVSKMSFEFGNNLLLVMDQQRWKSLGSFFRDLRKRLLVCKKDSECARRLSRLFSGTQYEARKRDSAAKPDRKLQQILQQMQELDRREDPPEPTQPFEERYDDDAEEAEDADDEENALETMLAAAMYPARTKDSPQKQRAGKPAAPRDPSATREPYVCLTKIFHGVCNKQGCTRSHNPQQVTKQRRELIEVMLKADAAEKSTGAPQKFAAMVDPDEDY